MKKRAIAEEEERWAKTALEVCSLLPPSCFIFCIPPSTPTGVAIVVILKAGKLKRRKREAEVCCICSLRRSSSLND
jgi:hypothetical protein